MVVLALACQKKELAEKQKDFRERQEKLRLDSIEESKKDQYRIAEMYTDSKSQIIDLIEGPATFEIKYEGSGNFTAKLLNSNGEIAEILADVNGPYSGTKAVTVPRTGSYILDVKCKGSWSVYRK